MMINVQQCSLVAAGERNDLQMSSMWSVSAPAFWPAGHKWDEGDLFSNTLWKQKLWLQEEFRAPKETQVWLSGFSSLSSCKWRFFWGSQLGLIFRDFNENGKATSGYGKQRCSRNGGSACEGIFSSNSACNFHQRNIRWDKVWWNYEQFHITRAFQSCSWGSVSLFYNDLCLF